MKHIVLTIGLLGFSLVSTLSWAQAQALPVERVTRVQQVKLPSAAAAVRAALPGKSATPAVRPSLSIRSMHLAATEENDVTPPTHPPPVTPLETGDEELDIDLAPPVIPATPPLKLDAAVEDSAVAEPTRPSASDPGEISAEIRDAIQHARKVQVEFLQKQQELRTSLRKATQEDRARIRDDMQQAREEYLALQRASRQELKKSVLELKSQLRFHHEAIDNAKEEAKDKAHSRRED